MDNKSSEGNLINGKNRGLMRNSKSILTSENEGKKHAYDEIIDTMVQNDRVNVDDKGIEGIRIIVKKLMSHSSPFGQLYDWVLIAISIASCLQFIYSTYVKDNKILEILDEVEMVWSAIFIFDILLGIWLEDHKLEHFQKTSVILSILAVIPIWVTHNRVCHDPIQATSSNDIVLYIIFALSSTRILRPWRIQKKIKELANDVQKCIGEMALTIVLMILFNAGLMQFLEKFEHFRAFHDWMYWAIVTAATVGYGDISPGTTCGRIACMIMISIGIIIVPKMTNDLIRIVDSSSVYARAQYVSKAYTKHVIICGDLDSTSLTEFFEELFHEDHDAANLEAVVLLPTPPNPEMRMLLDDPLFLTTVTYLQGTALSEKDLFRAKAEYAVGIFIMTNKFSNTPDKEDSKIILQQYSIKSYLHARNVIRMPYFGLQLIRDENMRHLATTTDHSSAGGDDKNKEVSICLNEVKLGLIAKSVMFPGASTLVMNLLTSFADGDEEEEIIKKAKGEDDKSVSIEKSASISVSNSISVTVDDKDRFKSDEWLDEYKLGCDWEIYTTELPISFGGSKFTDLALELYDQLGIVLMGLLIEENDGKKASSYVVLNPESYRIPSEADDLKLLGIVLAKNQIMADISQQKRKPGTMTSSAPSAASMFAHGPLMRSVVVAGQMVRKKNLADEVSTFTAHAPDPPAEEQNTRKRRVDIQTLQKQLKKVKESHLSQQEKIKFYEDMYLKSNYYVKEKAAKLSEAIITTGVLEEVDQINNHIIITGKGLGNLYDLIKPLKAKELGPRTYIVILYPDIIPQSVWQRISIFEDIRVVRGSPLEENDIRRAGVFRARQVVILADVTSQRINSGLDAKSGGSNQLDIAGLDALIDSDSIFTYKAVKRLNEKANVIVEFVKESNLEYMNLSGPPVVATAAANQDINTKKVSMLAGKEEDYHETPLFAAGSIFTSSLLDTLVCQTFYNPLIIDVIQRMLSTKIAKPTHTASEEDMSGLYEHGRAPEIPGLGRPRSSALYQVDVPETFVGKSYYSLFKHFTSHGIIPIALYRGIVPQIAIGKLMNRLPYVYTNPKKSAEIYFGDKVFILSPKSRYSINSTNGRNQENALMEQINDEFRQNRNLKSEIASSHRWILLLQRFEVLLKEKECPIQRKVAMQIGNRLRDLRQGVVQLMQDSHVQSQSNRAVPTIVAAKGRAGKLMIQLDQVTRKTKFVVDTYMPIARKLRKLFKRDNIIALKELVAQCVTKTIDPEYSRLHCYFTILKDAIDMVATHITPELPVPETPMKSNSISAVVPMKTGSISAVSPPLPYGHKRLTVYGEGDEADEDADGAVLSQSNVAVGSEAKKLQADSKSISSRFNSMIASITPVKKSSGYGSDNESSVSISMNNNNMNGRSSPQRSTGSFMFMTPAKPNRAGSAGTGGSFSLGSMVSTKLGASLAKAVLTITSASKDVEEITETDSRLNVALKKLALPSKEATEKQKLEQLFVKLHEKAYQIIADMLDAIEICIWDCSVDKVVAAAQATSES